MQEHQPSLFLEPIPNDKGQLLFKSQLLENDTEKTLDAEVYNRMIVLPQQNQYIEYNFDLRFSAKENQIQFNSGETLMTYQLPLGDGTTWRKHLKNYLNQKGFHEQFKPLKKIGKGNFATVFLVENVDNKERFAVKAFSKQAAYSQENGKQCIMKEIEIMRILDHQNNMKLYEVFESDNSLYFVFQLLEGGQLYEKIKAKKMFKNYQIREMIHGILAGLRELHAKNIMHRDLKPENILLRSEVGFDCVIADYGLAQFADNPNYLFVRCGTPGYVAPEVINIKDMSTKYDTICDMFSAGLIFHLFVFGQSVFPGKTYNEVLAQNRSCDFKLEGSKYDAIDKEGLDLMRRMLATNPADRITAAQALQHPYFCKGEDTYDEQKVQTLIEQENKQTMCVDSPILTTANKERRENVTLKKDSCLDFKMGKQNALTGKTETVAQLNSGKISSFNHDVLNGIRFSKFLKPTNKQ